jgi:HEPN domain-containing protein
MTSSQMARRYIEEAQGRMDLVFLAREKGMWSTVVREAQECVELYLKGALRLVAVEPVRSHDVAELLRSAAERFPDWFRSQVEFMASISTEMAGDRGIAFYGDERQEIGPQDLFDRDDGIRAIQNLEFVADHCVRLLAASNHP